MAIPPNALFVRVRHLGNSNGSIYLNDLDTYLNRYPELKIPVYVPFEGVIDIPLVDEVLISYNRGSLFFHAQNNLIEVFIFSERCVTQVTGVTEYQIAPDAEIVLVDTSQGDVTVTLPSLELLPQGREVIVKKSTEDENQLLIQSVAPDLIDQNLPEVTTTYPFAAFSFRTAEGGWWRISEYPSTVVDGGSGTGVDPKVYPHLAKRDSTNTSLVYVGTADAGGSNENDPVWQIYRQNIENTNEPRQYAGNTEDFIHIWDQRESLSYGA